MRAWFILVLLIFLAVPPAAQAQDTVSLETLTVRLWPEYDQPSMLVIYDFTVKADTPLPATVNIRIPKEGNITAVAYLDETLMNAEFAGPVEDGNWQVITFFVKEYTSYHLEYYQPILREGNKRSFKYKWTGTQVVENFRIEIQVPEDSTAVKSNPMLPFAPSQSFLNGSASADNLAAGETYQLDLQYSRPSEETVFPPSSPQVSASESVTQNAAGRVTLDSLPYILAGVGLLLILGAGYYFWQARAVPAAAPRRKRPNKKGDEVTSIYCHECGARAHAEDRFCRVCGTKLRTG